MTDIQVATREQIDQLERDMRNQKQAEVTLMHTYGPGFYARTITLEPGTELVGKVHATEHVFLLSEGELLVVTAEGGGRHLVAPAQFIAPAGVKRAGKALTRCIVTNIHITSETDLAKLEALLIAPEALPAPEALKEIA